MLKRNRNGYVRLDREDIDGGGLAIASEMLQRRGISYNLILVANLQEASNATTKDSGSLGWCRRENEPVAAREEMTGWAAEDVRWANLYI